MTTKAMIQKSVVALALVLLGAPAYATTKLSLADALAFARRHRSEVGQADIDIRLARLNILRAQLQHVHLTIEGSFSEQYQQINVNAPLQLCLQFGEACNVGSEGHIVNLSGNLSVPLWSGMTIEAETTRARALGRAAQAQKRATLRAIILEVTSAYWAVRRVELLLHVEEASIQRDMEIAASTRARVDAGIAPLADYNRAQTAILGKRSSILDFEARLAEARAQLGAALQIDDTFELTDDPLTVVPSLPPLEMALREAARTRPEIAATRAELEAQHAQVRSAQGMLWPQVNVFAQASATNQFIGVPQPSLIGNFVAGVSVNWLAFDMLTTWNNVREARFARDRAAASTTRVGYTVSAEVRAAHARLDKTVAQRATIEHAIELAVSTLDIIKRRYKAGTALLIEVIDAEEELLRLESQQVDNAVGIAEAQAALDAARGAS
jgi:outer membrane protein TolC